MYVCVNVCSESLEGALLPFLLLDDAAFFCCLEFELVGSYVGSYVTSAVLLLANYTSILLYTVSDCTLHLRSYCSYYTVGPTVVSLCCLSCCLYNIHQQTVSEDKHPTVRQ